MADENIYLNPVKERMLSLDIMRGVIMILLAAESCLVYDYLLEGSGENGLFTPIIKQFFHHKWHGLLFWDLIQPAFMFMAGAALYLSWHAKEKNGITWGANFKHILIRCFKLFLLGTGLHCVFAGKLVWELWNVLTQLSITTIIAYLIIRKSNVWQIIFSLLLLVLIEILYRYTHIPGFEQPFVKGVNFGSYMDMVLMGKINSGGWIAINFIPTAAHTIWGVLAGKLLVSKKTANTKILYLIIFGVISLFVGYALDLSSVTPIIKRISTSSFVLVSGGYVLLILAFLYWLVDIKKWNKYGWIFTVVGMNAIFIYLVFETIGGQWLNGFVGIFAKGFFGFIISSENILNIISALSTLLLEWALCYWLYKKKIFFKL